MKNAGIVQEHDLPSSLANGETYTATWSLDIYNCEGFARFQVQLPDGIIAEPTETARASFSFESGKAKFIWMELPPQNTLQVSLRLTADPSFVGGTVTQWFSFIRNSGRKDAGSSPPLGEGRTRNRKRKQTSWRPATRADAHFAIRRHHDCYHQRARGRSIPKVDRRAGRAQGSNILDDTDCQIRDAFDDKLVFIWQAAPVGPIAVKYTLRGGEPEQVFGSIAAVRGADALEAEVAPLETSIPEETKPDTDALSVDVPSIPRGDDIAFRVQVLAAFVCGLKR